MFSIICADQSAFPTVLVYSQKPQQYPWDKRFLFVNCEEAVDIQS